MEAPPMGAVLIQQEVGLQGGGGGVDGCRSDAQDGGGRGGGEAKKKW